MLLSKGCSVAITDYTGSALPIKVVEPWKRETSSSKIIVTISAV